MLSKKPTYLQLVSLSGWTIPFKNEHKIKFAYFISNNIRGINLCNYRASLINEKILTETIKLCKVNIV